MPIPLANTLPIVRYYTEFDQYYYTVDNRPIQDLAARDVQLANAIDAASNTPGRLLRTLTFTTSGVYSKTADCTNIEVELWGAGAGSTDGGDTDFNNGQLIAHGGATIGTGGTSVGGILNLVGSNGTPTTASATISLGGASPRGGQGSLCQAINTTANGVFPGGGGAEISGLGVGKGGGGGGYCYWFGAAPTSSVGVVVGIPGTGNGSAGLCVIKEYS